MKEKNARDKYRDKSNLNRKIITFFENLIPRELLVFAEGSSVTKICQSIKSEFLRNLCHGLTTFRKIFFAKGLLWSYICGQLVITQNWLRIFIVFELFITHPIHCLSLLPQNDDFIYFLLLFFSSFKSRCLHSYEYIQAPFNKWTIFGLVSTRLCLLASFIHIHFIEHCCKKNAL